MPAKKSTNKTTSKPRTSKKAKTMKPQLKIWMGLLVVLIVALVGVVFVVRFSEAGSSWYIKAYCKEGNCKLTKSSGYGETTVRVVRDSSCNSGYRYTFVSTTESVALAKRSRLRCLGA